LVVRDAHLLEIVLQHLQVVVVVSYLLLLFYQLPFFYKRQLSGKKTLFGYLEMLQLAKLPFESRSRQHVVPRLLSSVILFLDFRLYHLHFGLVVIYYLFFMILDHLGFGHLVLL